MHTKKKTAMFAAAALAATLTLAACGGSEDGDAASADHNDQDVAFATEMIPHHAQAVAMSEIAADNASSPEVRELADEISTAQGPEIEQMSSWLEAWGEDVPDTDGTSGMSGMNGMEDMPGMMSPGEMEDLEGASGAAFDVMFLTMMIEHHEGAVEMAETEQADGEYADAVALAETIEETQTREIATMEELLASM